MRRIVSPFGSYQADLQFFKKLGTKEGLNTVLNVININNKRAYSVILRNKDGINVANGMRQILSQIHAREPEDEVFKIETDDGTEFTGKEFQKLLKEKNIIHLTFDRRNHSSLSIIERLNGTMRRKAGLFMNNKNTTAWKAAWADLLEGYNNSIHSALGKSPEEFTRDDEWQRMKTLVRYNLNLKEGKMFKVGDRVRVRLLKTEWRRADDNGWSKAVHTVQRVVGKRYDIGLKYTVQARDLIKAKLRESEVEEKEDVVEVGKKADRVERRLRKAGVAESNVVVRETREKKLPLKLRVFVGEDKREEPVPAPPPRTRKSKLPAEPLLVEDASKGVLWLIRF